MGETAVEPDDVGGDDGEGERKRAVARRLREARRAAGLTQKQVAERIGVSRRSVFEWERAVRLPTTALPDLAGVYGVTPSFLLYGPEPSADLVIVVDELQLLAAEIKAVRGEVVDLAEATERAFGQLRSILEALRSERERTGETPPSAPPDGSAQSSDET